MSVALDCIPVAGQGRRVAVKGFRQLLKLVAKEGGEKAVDWSKESIAKGGKGIVAERARRETANKVDEVAEASKKVKPTTEPAAVKGAAAGEANGKGAPAGGKTEQHGNVADDRPATLYEKYDADDNFLKHGVTKHEDPTKRYTKKEIDGGQVVAVERGPRREMLKKERELVETKPGPDNHEPWAGKRKAE